jgi:glutamate-1-semialdehyde 2,1-aminomutase
MNNSSSSQLNTFLDSESHSAKLFREARGYIPYCTSKANQFIQPNPLFVEKGSGCWVTDVDGKTRLDCSNSFTALIHGHAFPPVVKAVSEQLLKGTNFSFPAMAELDLAKLMVKRVRSLEKIRFFNSGTEAVMMAIKAARVSTGRDRIAKFEGAYHGYYDDVQVSMNSIPPDWGDDTSPASIPGSGGIPKHRVLETVILPWNELDSIERLIIQHKDELAAIVVDPFCNIMGFIPPDPGFLEQLREITRAHGILMIFDEVLSFRLDYGGAQELFGGDPDLTAFGKIMGGGFPIGAVGGKEDVMAVFDPGSKGNKIIAGGTYSANPVSMVAGHAAMEAFSQDEIARLADMGRRLRKRLTDVFIKYKKSGQVTGEGSLYRIMMTDKTLHSYRDTVDPNMGERFFGSDKQSKELFMALLDEGVIAGNNGLGCLSTPMGEAELDHIESAFDKALSSIEDD